MRHNTAKERLRLKKPALGTWLTLPDPLVAQQMAQVGFDWLNVDLEHNPINPQTAALMFQAIAQAGGVPLARVPANTEENIKRVLDAGAWGIICPMVNTPEEAEQVVAFAKYPPQGVRSIGGALRTLSFNTDTATYNARANEETLVVIQAEHIRAVENADAILSVPGIDAVFIGPNDLSASMGVRPGGDCADARVAAAVAHVRAAAVRHGVAPGIHVFNAEAARQRLAEGFLFLALAAETHFMLAGARDVLTKARPEA